MDEKKNKKYRSKIFTVTQSLIKSNLLSHINLMGEI